MSNPTLSATQQAIKDECNRIADFLIDKNRKYGDSAINPIRMFSKASAVEQILIRIDDKISRITRGDRECDTEDVFEDLVGYIILLRIAKRLDNKGKV